MGATSEGAGAEGRVYRCASIKMNDYNAGILLQMSFESSSVDRKTKCCLIDEIFVGYRTINAVSAYTMSVYQNGCGETASRSVSDLNSSPVPSLSCFAKSQS